MFDIIIYKIWILNQNITIKVNWLKNYITIKEFVDLLLIQFHQLISNILFFVICDRKQESFEKSF